MSDAARTFVGTNVLACAHDTSDARRQPIAQALLSNLWQAHKGIISTQVLSEFNVVATRKFDPPMPRREARSIIDAYSVWPVVQVETVPILAASALAERHQLSFLDAQMAIGKGGARRLATEDLQAGRRIGELVSKTPSNADGLDDVSGSAGRTVLGRARRERRRHPG